MKWFLIIFFSALFLCVLRDFPFIVEREREVGSVVGRCCASELSFAWAWSRCGR